MWENILSSSTGSTDNDKISGSVYISQVIYLNNENSKCHWSCGLLVLASFTIILKLTAAIYALWIDDAGELVFLKILTTCCDVCNPTTIKLSKKCQMGTRQGSGLGTVGAVEDRTSLL